LSFASDERKIALIPKVVVTSRMGPKEYALLVTNARSILVLEKDSKAGLAGMAGGVIGSAIAQAAATRKTFDYEKGDLQWFAANPKNLIIPHQAMEKIKMKKAFLNPVYRMQVHYRTAVNDRKKINAFLRPPGELVSQQKAQGLGRGQIHLDYARKVQEVYRQVLSPPHFETVMSSRL
jgi:hypothetical protein